MEDEPLPAGKEGLRLAVGTLQAWIQAFRVEQQSPLEAIGFRPLDVLAGAPQENRVGSCSWRGNRGSFS